MNFTPSPEFEYNDNFTHSNDFNENLSIIAIGDPHFKTCNLTSIDIYITNILTAIEQTNPSFIVLLGDLLHEHEKIHTSVLNKAYGFIHQLRQKLKVFVIVGNHDYINNQQFLSENHWMNAMKQWDNVVIVDSGFVYPTPVGKIVFCPYVHPGRFEEALDYIDVNWKSARIIFCHQEIYGCKMGAIVSIDGDKWELTNPFIISGHIHDKQRIQSNVFYTGSSIQHAFGESTDKTISYCHLGKTIKLEKIDLGLSTKRILYTTVKELETFTKTPNENEQWRITTTGSIDEFKLFRKTKKYKELVKKGIKIVYKHKPVECSIVDNNSPQLHHASFEEILNECIHTKNNTVLTELYKELI